MSIDKILSIGGKPGLFKLVTQTRTDTLEEEIPLREVFLNIQVKEKGGTTSIGHKEDKLKLEEYFFEVLPNYDEDRVYPSDIKKVIQWYNILHAQGITDFSEEDEDTDAEEE